MRSQTRDSLGPWILPLKRALKSNSQSSPCLKPITPTPWRFGWSPEAGEQLSASAQSIGGGAFQFTRLDRWPVMLTGNAHELLIEITADAEPAVLEFLSRDVKWIGAPERQIRGDLVLLHLKLHSALDPETKSKVRALPGVSQLWTAPPVFFPLRGEPLFASADEMIALASSRSLSLGQMALAYEATSPWPSGAGSHGGNHPTL